jgi:hypothetical protein
MSRGSGGLRATCHLPCAQYSDGTASKENKYCDNANLAVHGKSSLNAPLGVTIKSYGLCHGNALQPGARQYYVYDGNA